MQYDELRILNLLVTTNTLFNGVIIPAHRPFYGGAGISWLWCPMPGEAGARPADNSCASALMAVTGENTDPGCLTL